MQDKQIDIEEMEGKTVSQVFMENCDEILIVFTDASFALIYGYTVDDETIVENGNFRLRNWSTHAEASRCSTLDGKWSISTNEEEYHGVFDSMEDAIAEGKASEEGSFYVGRCVSPVQPEVLFTGDAIEDWLERHVWAHDEYSHEWAEGHVCPTSDEMAELADEIRPLIAAWLDRCKLRPTFWNIDPASVRKIDA